MQKPYVAKSGTSMATPMVSGAIACLLSKYPDMTNVEVKLKLRESLRSRRRYAWLGNAACGEAAVSMKYFRYA